MQHDEVAAIVRDLPTLTPPDGLPVTASLGGVQAKVLLTRTDEGWAWPAAGAASTHIIKPAPISDIAVPHLVESEEWAMRVARGADLRVARADGQQNTSRAFDHPSPLTRIATTASDEARDRSAFQVDLLRAVTFNILIGNGDAHSKNTRS